MSSNHHIIIENDLPDTLDSIMGRLTVIEFFDDALALTWAQEDILITALFGFKNPDRHRVMQDFNNFQTAMETQVISVLGETDPLYTVYFGNYAGISKDIQEYIQKHKRYLPVYDEAVFQDEKLIESLSNNAIKIIRAARAIRKSRQQQPSQQPQQPPQQPQQPPLQMPPAGYDPPRSNG